MACRTWPGTIRPSTSRSVAEPSHPLRLSVVAAPKWPDELSRELGRETVVLDARCWRPLPFGHVKGAEESIDPREVHGEVLVYRLHRMVPVMKAREDHKLVQDR